MKREARFWVRAILAAACATLPAACSAQDPGKYAASEPAGTANETGADTSVASPAAPNLAGCPARPLLEDGLRQRTGPIPVPAELSTVMASDMDNVAIVMLDGATQCIDSSWMEEFHDARLSADGRFASFGWAGYEAFGHVIVDRREGQVLDTGVTPVFSPAGRRFASADLSESGYGALNAFAVWQIEPAGIRQLGKLEEVPSATDWRIERWAGETCIELSAIPWDGDAGDAEAVRERFKASQADGWRIEPARCAAE